MTSPRLLFVPASGARGAGEYFRSISIAQAARQRWPDCAVRFIVNREAGYARDGAFDTTLVDGSPTFSTAVVRQTIDDYRPQVVIFDSAGRVAQLAHARGAGAATIYVSSRFKTRWKGFRFRRMRHLDQHWLAWPQFLEGGLTRWERAKLRLMRRPEVVFLDPVRPAADPVRAAQTLSLFGLSAGDYVIFSGGGGGYSQGGLCVPEIFGHAALEVHRATGHPVAWVRGPNYGGAGLGSSGIVQLGAVQPEQMFDLLGGARAAVVNGGSLLLQAIAAGTIAVAAPVAGDQPRRIEACARMGLVAASPLVVQSIAATTLELLSAPQRCAAMRARARELELGNGADQAVDAIARLCTKRQESR